MEQKNIKQMEFLTRKFVYRLRDLVSAKPELLLILKYFLASMTYLRTADYINYYRNAIYMDIVKDVIMGCSEKTQKHIGELVDDLEAWKEAVPEWLRPLIGGFTNDFSFMSPELLKEYLPKKYKVKINGLTTFYHATPYDRYEAILESGHILCSNYTAENTAYGQYAKKYPANKANQMLLDFAKSESGNVFLADSFELCLKYAIKVGENAYSETLDLDIGKSDGVIMELDLTGYEVEAYVRNDGIHYTVPAAIPIDRITNVYFVSFRNGELRVVDEQGKEVVE